MLIVAGVAGLSSLVWLARRKPELFDGCLDFLEAVADLWMDGD